LVLGYAEFADADLLTLRTFRDIAIVLPAEALRIVTAP